MTVEVVAMDGVCIAFDTEHPSSATIRSTIDGVDYAFPAALILAAANRLDTSRPKPQAIPEGDGPVRPPFFYIDGSSIHAMHKNGDKTFFASTSVSNVHACPCGTLAVLASEYRAQGDDWRGMYEALEDERDALLRRVAELELKR